VLVKDINPGIYGSNPRYLTEAAALRDDNPLVWAARGGLHGGVGLWDLAAEDFERSFRLHRSNEANVWNEHALLRLYVGDAEGYRRACRLMVDHFGPDAYGQTGWWVASTCVVAPNDVDPQRVVRLAEGARRTDPQRITYLFALGAAHHRAGEYQKAVEHLHEARRGPGVRRPRGPTIAGPAPGAGRGHPPDVRA
jgi:uncharacterized protein HemY